MPIPCLLAAVALVAYLLCRYSIRITSDPDGVSPQWRQEQQRREMASGVDQSCVNWIVMQQQAKERGVI